MKMTERKQKLIIGHTYTIYDIEKQEIYCGKCECNEVYNDSYLFSDVRKYKVIEQYIGLKDFSINNIFINTHAKID